MRHFESTWKERITRFYPRRSVLDVVVMITGGCCALFFVTFPVFGFLILATTWTDMTRKRNGFDRS